MFANLFRVCIVIALPVGCIFFADYLAGPAAWRLEGAEIGALCLLDAMAADREISCLAEDWVAPFRGLAWISLGLGVLPIVVFIGSAKLCGASRWLNVAVFRRLVPLAIGLICVNMLVQGMLLLSGVVLLYSAHIGNPPMAALIAAGGAIAAGAIAVVGGALAMRLDPVLPVRALPLKREAAPRLWALVEGLAQRLGAEPPDAIVVGLEPTFWVIAGDVRPTGGNLPGRLIKGRTLFVSLPLMHVLTLEEFTAIIGHELGHFRGRDSEYSARFMPAYQALTGAEYGLDDAADLGDTGHPLATLLAWVSRVPARALLTMLGTAFHGNVQRISRIREYEADAAAAEVADPRAATTALFKIPLYAQLWHDLIEDHVARVALGRPIAPLLGTHFADMSRLLVTPENAVALREYALEARAEHPFDSHPSSFNRAVELGIDPDEVTPEELRAGEEDGVAEALFGDLDEIEFFLSTAENDALLQEGAIPYVPPSMQSGKVDALYHGLYSVFAALVAYSSDPAVRYNAVAERCQASLQKFDRLVLAGYCRGRTEALPAEDAVAVIVENVGESGLAKVAEIAMSAVAAAGLRPRPEEAAVLAFLDPGRVPPAPSPAAAAVPTSPDTGARADAAAEVGAGIEADPGEDTPSPDEQAINGWLSQLLGTEAETDDDDAVADTELPASPGSPPQQPQG